MNTPLQTLLIVDDDATTMRMLVEVLQTTYDLRTARTGNRALAIATSEAPPDLILMDIGLPDVDGYEVCRRLQSDLRTRSIPVIFITSRDQEGDEVEGFRAGAVDYVTKPFSPVIVQARIRTHAELARLRTSLERLSNTDGLTGIANRRRMEDLLETSWSYGIRSRSWMACIMVDIDHFKRFNDHCGHQAGDACIVAIAQAMQGCIRRKTDLLARYGGEEFCCIMPATDLVGAQSLANQFADAVQALQIPNPLPEVSPCVTISQGVSALRPTLAMSPAELVHLADQALYEAKAAGRNRIISREALPQAPFGS